MYFGFKLYERLALTNALFIFYSQSSHTLFQRISARWFQVLYPTLPSTISYWKNTFTDTLIGQGNHNCTFPPKSILSVSGTANINKRNTGVILETSISQWSASPFILAHSVLWGDLWWHSPPSVVHNTELWPLLPKAQNGSGICRQGNEESCTTL